QAGNNEFHGCRRTITRDENQHEAVLPIHRPPTHPGEMLLEEFLKPLGISQSAFAIRLGVSFPRLNEIIRGKRAVTPDTALRLARVLGIPGHAGGPAIRRPVGPPAPRKASPVPPGTLEPQHRLPPDLPVQAPGSSRSWL